MNCPKCGTLMYHYDGPSTASSLRLGISTMVAGYQCPPTGCGKWIDEDVEPVCPRPDFSGFVRLRSENDRNTRIQGRKALEIIIANFDAITRMKKDKWSWIDICDRFKIKIHHQLCCRKYREVARGEHGEI